MEMEPPASESPNSLPFKKRARMVDTSSSEQQQQQQQEEALSLPGSNNNNGNALNSISRISPETASAIAALTPEHVNPINNSTTSSINNSITRTNSPHEDSLEEILNADLCIAKAFQAADEAWGSVSNKYLQSKVIFTLEDVFQMIRPAIDQMMKQEEEKKKKQEGKKKFKKKSKTQKTEKTSGTSNNGNGIGTATKSNKSTAVAAVATTTTTVPKRGKTLPNLSSVRKSPVQQEPLPKTTPSPTTTQSTSTSKKRKRETSNEYTYAQQAFSQENIPHNLPKSLALPTDSKFINKLHQFVRSDLLEIIQEDERIGFQCIFCKHNTNPQQMHKFFPTCLENSSGGIYRSVCTWQRVHFKSCNDVPKLLKKKYDALKEADRTRGRVQYWEDSAKQIGLWNKKDGGICFIGDGSGDGC